MKNTNPLISKLSLIGLAIFTSNAYAEGSYYQEQKEREQQMTLEERKMRVMTCGHYDEVGPSTIFGMPGEYQSKYPKLGYLSAEIDRVAKVDPDIRKSVQVIFRDAKDKWDRLDYSLEKNRKMLKRNSAEVNTTLAIKDNTMRIFESSQSEIQKEQRFVLSKAKKEVVSLMKSDATQIGPDKSTPSSWDQLETCRQWWLFEQREIPEWQKQNKQYQSLNDLEGQNYGYGVEQQFSDGLSSNRNAGSAANKRVSNHSSGFSNSNRERFKYNYETDHSTGSSSRPSSNGGLEMQW